MINKNKLGRFDALFQMSPNIPRRFVKTIFPQMFVPEMRQVIGFNKQMKKVVAMNGSVIFSMESIKQKIPLLTNIP